MEQHVAQLPSLYSVGCLCVFYRLKKVKGIHQESSLEENLTPGV